MICFLKRDREALEVVKNVQKTVETLHSRAKSEIDDNRISLESW